MSKNIIIINGPNLNLLGEREKAHYGTDTLDDIRKKCIDYAKKKGINLDFFQSNIEGEIVNTIQSSKDNFQGIIINAAGYTHTSVSILDALIAIKIPTIELHISNIYAREDFRHKSLISKAARGIICGFGSDGYLMAIDAMVKILKNENR
tara:strand:- start:102 stop:551 length:450 start_codon:yes stop_codon:yes gene_type:complete